MYVYMYKVHMKYIDILTFSRLKMLLDSFSDVFSCLPTWIGHIELVAVVQKMPSSKFQFSCC